MFEMAFGRSTIGRKRQSSGIGLYYIPYDKHKFRSFIHKQLYAELETKNFLHEKMLELEDPGEYFDMVQDINTRGYGVLVTTMKLSTLTWSMSLMHMPSLLMVYLGERFLGLGANKYNLIEISCMRT